MLKRGKIIRYLLTKMPIILNLITREYFIANDKKEQNMYLRKLLSRDTLEEFQICWKYVSTITIFKSVVEWNRTDKIIEVPPHIENFVLNNNQYHQISLIEFEFDPFGAERLGAMLRACDPRTKKVRSYASAISALFTPSTISESLASIKSITLEEDF